MVGIGVRTVQRRGNVSTTRGGERDDDSLFEIGRKKRKEAKRNPPKGPRVIPGSACCGTCSQWIAPGPKDDYGGCREVVVVGRGDSERLMGYEDARRAGHPFSDFLATSGGFAACRYYDGDGTRLPVDTTDDEYPKFEVTALRERIREERT
jgi:hypothetical protein